MGALFLSPHNDDETLFGAFTLLRHKPHVVVVLRSWSQEHRHGFKVSHETREAETAAAMEILGCTWEQWPFFDEKVDWRLIDERLGALRIENDYERVFAPAPEAFGNQHHNMIGALAELVWPGKVTSFMTYQRANNGIRSIASPVEFEWPWVELKLRALACYRSQMMTSTGDHFLQGLREWYA